MDGNGERGAGGKSLAKGARNGKRGRKMEEVDRVRCGVVVRSFVREGSVLGSRNMV